MMPASTIAAGSMSERADDYCRVIARLNPDWRVIECTGAVQWIVQRRLPGERATDRWQAKSHCRSREGLLALVARHCGDVNEAGARTLHALPEWIGKRA